MNNAPIPAWLAAAVMAAGMTAYADDCDVPRARPVSAGAALPAHQPPHDEESRRDPPAPDA